MLLCRFAKPRHSSSIAACAPAACLLQMHSLALLFSTSTIGFTVASQSSAMSSSSSSIDASSPSNTPAPPPMRVAIIGGGVAAASAAYFLRDLVSKKQQQPWLDIIAPEVDNSVTGGRLAVEEFDSVAADGASRRFESGGSIIHEKNLYMRHFAERVLQLPVLHHGEEMRLAVYNGKGTVLDTSDWYMVKMVQLLHRYGLGTFVRLRRFITALLEDFGRIYARQNAGQAFTTVRGLLEAMSDKFPPMMDQSIEKLLLDSGFDPRFVHELVAGAMRNNYGQNVSIHGFVGAVSLAGAEGGLWSVRGGNRRVVGRLLDDLLTSSAGAPQECRLRLGRRVTRIARDSAGSGWLVTSVGGGEDDSGTSVDRYDQVVLTAPAHQEFDIQLEGASVTRVDYQTTVATFVKGELNHTGLGLASREERYSLLTGSPAAPLDFNSIGYQFDVRGQPTNGVYKVFSERPLTAAQLSRLFTRVEATRSTPWLAYPLYHHESWSSAQKNASFVLAEGLYHTSPIELAASAMEMSAVAGRNAALLAYNHWTGRAETLTNPPLDKESRPKPQDKVAMTRHTEL